MAFTRRDWLKWTALGASSGALGGCAHLANRLAGHPKDTALPLGDVDVASRLLNRVTFGPRPGEINQVKKIGLEQTVDRLLSPNENEDLRLQFLLNRLDVFQMDAYETQDLPENEVIRQLQQSAILRATYGKHQLRERMVDFWTNHFNIYGRKGLAAFRKGADESHVIRAHALGTFPQLLSASAHSPAMLVYLDNQGNVSGHPNENYAREVMELHTLGVNGGYSQRDVQEVARCFTGWTLERRYLHHRWAFRFDATVHDDGTKHVLGQTIPAGGGEKDADCVLDILANHPATAHHIATKLCNYFLGESGAKWIEPTAETYWRTKGDIRAMLRPILLSPALLDSPPILKRPFDYMVSALRAVDADTDGSTPLQEHLVQMGEPLYQWPMPDGYPTKTSAWTGSMLPRWNFAYELSHGNIRGTGIDWDGVIPHPTATSVFELIHGRHPSPNDTILIQELDRRLSGKDTSASDAGFVCLASPSFQWR